jgi:3-isopropylmalate/(R)-2-methylmalate dehydratase large subunit
MCVAINDDKVGPNQRCISSSNRNFENRQGPRARTHLASPASVAAAAVTGVITDVRKLMS